MLRKRVPSFSREASRAWRLAWPALLAALACCGSCSRQGDTGEDPNVTSKGSIEVTAELVEIRGQLPDLPNYNYAFVMKYKVLEVHRGQVGGQSIYVAHYNPRKPRDAAADAAAKGIGGNLKRFEPGNLHRMALEVPIDEHYMGAIIDRYFDDKKAQPASEPIYWAVWTNRVAK